MDNKSYDLLLIVQATIDANRKDYDDEIKNLTEDLIAMMLSMMNYI